MSTVTEVLDYLLKKNFVNSFEVRNGKMKCKETGESFTRDELVINEIHRFEGDSNPDDMSVIYAMTAGSGTKGILIDAYGTYSDPEISEFMKEIPMI